MLSALMLFASGCMFSRSTQQVLDAEEKIEVTIRTELGDIEMVLYPTRAPKTVTNFLRYVDGDFFTRGEFFRTVRLDNQPNDSIQIEVIQGRANSERGSDSFDPIVLERTNSSDLLHVDGALSMARSGPDSATSSFFICINDQPELDFGGQRNPDGQGFAVFGQVTKGMDIVRAIQTLPAEAQSLTDPVLIESISQK